MMKVNKNTNFSKEALELLEALTVSNTNRDHLLKASELLLYHQRTQTLSRISNSLEKIVTKLNGDIVEMAKKSNEEVVKEVAKVVDLHTVTEDE